MDQLHAAGLYPGFEIMGNPGKETPLFAVPFIYENASFYQDRLGTNIGKALKKEWLCFLRE